MPQEEMSPARNELKEKPFSSATNVTCTIRSGSGDVTFNNENSPRKFGGNPGEIKELSLTGITIIKITGTSEQNKFRIDF